MSITTIKEFVHKVFTLLGDKVDAKKHTDAMTALTIEFCNSIKEKKDAKEKKGVKKDAKKDGGLKKPPNSYLLFSSAVRGLVKAANPDMKLTDVSKEIGKQWTEEKEANTETYQKYTKEAEQKKAEYKTATSSSDASSSDEEEKTAKTETKKRAPSAYNIFYSIMYAELVSSMTSDEIRAQISSVWKKLTPEEKEEYKGKALSPKKDKKLPKVEEEEVKAGVKKADVKKEKKADTKKADTKVVEEEVKADTKKADTKKADAKKVVAEEVKADAKKEKKADAKKKKADAKKEKKADAKKADADTEEEDEVSLEDFDDDDFGTVPPPKKQSSSSKAVPRI